MALQSVEHLGIMVNDLDRSVDFYTQTLGFELVQTRTFGSAKLAFVKFESLTLELIWGVDGYTRGDSQLNHLAFRVDQIETAIETLKGKDPALTFTEPMELWDGKRCVFFRGPDDERLELFGA